MKAKTITINSTYDKWFVTNQRRVRPGAAKNIQYFCRCKCGTGRWVNASDLASERSTNCGCVRRDGMSKRNKTHGKTRTREYVVWCGMIARCHNPNHKAYDRYGGRGIRVCRQWRASFEKFIEYMGWPTSAKLALDRIDNDRGYKPGNVRWVTAKANANNTKSNHRLTFRGLALTVTEWADRLGIQRYTIHNRLRLGWSTEKTLSTPTRSAAIPQVNS